MSDFGLAREVYMGMTDKYMYSHLGTSIYKSPEMLKGEEYCSKTDIWSLGIVIY